LAFRTNPLKKHDQLELEEDCWIDAWSSSPGRIAVLDEVAHEGEIEHAVEVAVEMVGRD
jgi:hypothetical protein